MEDFITRSEKETVEFCSSIAKLISLPSVININGDLGTGKTFISNIDGSSLGNRIASGIQD